MYGLNKKKELEKFNMALAVVNSYKKYDDSIPSIKEIEKLISNKKFQIKKFEKNILKEKAKLKDLENIKSNLLNIANFDSTKPKLTQVREYRRKGSGTTS